MLTAAEYPWFALSVKSRHEKHVSFHLQQRGYQELLPLYETQYANGRRGLLPLFPGYVFCRLDPSNRLPVLSVPGVFGIVAADRRPLPVPEQEIAAVQRVIESPVVARPWPYLQAGDWVEITAGPLQGLRGILTDARNTHWLVVSVNLLQRSMAVKVERDCARPLDGQGRAYRPLMAMTASVPAA